MLRERFGPNARLSWFQLSAVERYVGCGQLANGFVRVRCTSCGDDRLVAFSCKVRGLCPSCDGRRMVDEAAHLVDEVLPIAPYRQFAEKNPAMGRSDADGKFDGQRCLERLFPAASG